jgi:hypothetical protein
MTSEVPYEYTDRDLFEEPEAYEYTTVYGKPFLEAYLADRSETVEIIDRRLSNAEPIGVNSWDGMLNALGRGDTVRAYLPGLSGVEMAKGQSLPDPATTESVETIPLLAQLLGYPEDAPPSNEASTEWVNRMIERFEIHKRLYTAYGPEMRPVEEKEAAKIAYPMLALAALVVNERTESLKLLNGTLKICDSLSSTDVESMNIEIAALTRLALATERDAIKTLAAKKEVHL